MGGDYKIPGVQNEKIIIQTAITEIILMNLK